MSYLFGTWYCCLAQSYASALPTLAFLFAARLNQPITVDEWETVWLASGGSAWEIDTAKRIWGLEDTVIVIPDEPPIPAIGIDAAGWWTALQVFLLSPAALCDGGCSRAKYWLG